MATTKQRETAIRLAKMGFTSRKIAEVVGVSHMTVIRWSDGHLLPNAGGGPRKYDHDEALRLLQDPFWTQERVAWKMGVCQQTISWMVKQRRQA